MDKYKSEFIDFMAESGVLTFGDFVTKSGRKTPYFVNTGNYKTGSQIAKLGHYYAKCMIDCIGNDFDVLFGPAYKGIPLATAATAALYLDFGFDKSYCFNRKEAKDHGEGGSIVGAKLKDGDKVVIIEDVMTAGTSIRETLPILKCAADVKVKHIVISVDRMEKGINGKTAVNEIEEEFGVSVHPIVNVREIIEHMSGKISDDDIKRMKLYISEYCAK